MASLISGCLEYLRKYRVGNLHINNHCHCHDGLLYPSDWRSRLYPERIRYAESAQRAEASAEILAGIPTVVYGYSLSRL